MVAPRIALWGTFDVDNYGDQLFPRVACHELGRRGVDVDVYSPYGWLHPTPLDSGPVVRPLGPWSAERAGRFAAAYDAVVVGGGELIHLDDRLLGAVYGVSGDEIAGLAPSRFFVEALGAQLEAGCPVVWHALGVPVEPESLPVAERLRSSLRHRRYVAVRDRFSAERLRRAGVEGEIAVVPDSALLIDRLLPRAALDGRLAALRATGCYPTGPAIVVQGCDLVIPRAGVIADRLGRWLDRHDRGWEIVALETGRCRGDAAFADALAASLAPRPVRRLPPTATVEDLAAAVAGAAVFAGTSLHGAITALVYDVPWVLVNAAGEPKLDGFGDLIGLGPRVVRSLDGFPGALDAVLDGPPAPDGLLAHLQHRVDHHFDRIAALAAEAAGARRGAAGGNGDGDGGAALERDSVVAHVDGLRTALAAAHRAAVDAETALAALRATKTFRYTARARGLYGRVTAAFRSH